MWVSCLSVTGCTSWNSVCPYELEIGCSFSEEKAYSKTKAILLLDERILI